jgi:hypothetical protein
MARVWFGALHVRRHHAGRPGMSDVEPRDGQQAVARSCEAESEKHVEEAEGGEETVTAERR